MPIYLFFALTLNGLNAQTTDSIPAPAAKPSDWDVAVEAVQLAGEARFMRDSFTQTAAQRTLKRETVERNLQKAQADTTSAAELLKNLKTDLRNAQKEEKEAEKNVKRAEEAVTFAESVSNMESRQQRAQISKSRKQVQQLKNILYTSRLPDKKEKPEKEEKPTESAVTTSETPAPADSSSTATVQNPPENSEKRRKPKPAAPESKVVAKTYSLAQDVMINPPVPACVLASTVRDEFSGEIRKETPRKEIFRYTNQALRKQYTMEKPHTIGEASLLSFGLNAALHLTFRIHDLNVRRTQGSLQKGGTATLKFTDGSSIILYDSRSDEGVTDPEGQSVIFQAQFPIDRTTIKKIRSTELDRIRVAWANGYEDYDVQQVDQLMWQAKCLFEQ